MQSYGPNSHASKNFFHEFNLAAMIPAATSPSIYPKLIENYQQQIFTQSCGIYNHVTPAFNRCPIRLSVILTKRPKAVGVPKTRKYSDANTIYKVTMEPGNTVKIPNRYPLIEPLAHNKLTSPSPLSLFLHRNLTLSFLNEAQNYNCPIIILYFKSLDSLNMLLLSSTLVIIKSTTTYPQIYHKYTEHRSHISPSSIYLYYPMLYPLIRSSQQLNSHNTLFISYCIDHDSTAPSHNLYGSNYHGQNCKQTQLNVKCNYLTHSNLHKRTRTDIQSNYPGKLSSSCLNSDQCLLCKINSSLSTQVERPKAVGVPTTCKYPDANTPSVPTPLRIAFNTTTPIPEPSRLTQHNSTYPLQPAHCQAQTYQC